METELMIETEEAIVKQIYVNGVIYIPKDKAVNIKWGDIVTVEIPGIKIKYKPWKSTLYLTK